MDEQRETRVELAKELRMRADALVVSEDARLMRSAAAALTRASEPTPEPQEREATEARVHGPCPTCGNPADDPTSEVAFYAGDQPCWEDCPDPFHQPEATEPWRSDEEAQALIDAIKGEPTEARGDLAAQLDEIRVDYADCLTDDEQDVLEAAASALHTPTEEGREATEARGELADIAVRDVFPARAKDGLPWSWDDEARNTRTRQCLCCGKPGHYQEQLENYMAAHGVEGLGILVDPDGYVDDGHHRVVAALRLGIERLPVETQADAQARWVRDHGHVDWSARKVGDR